MRSSLTKATTKDGAIRALAFAVATLASIAAIFSGLAGSFESDLRTKRDHLRIAPASGEIVIVEVDGRSLQALEQWPWPRSYYAKAVRQLDRLGAEQIAFDIDVSSRSTLDGDAEFAKALAELGGAVILPTFRQENQAAGGSKVTEALPHEAFRKHAFLASVNVFPNSAGQIEFYPYGIVTDGVPRPSLPTMVTGVAGQAGQAFRVDQAIDPASIERISFVDLIEGNVGRDRVSGKKILIGATAIELGDRYPTGQFGVQPGVVIQAQAAETLLQDRIRSDSGPWIPLLVVIAIIGALALRKTQRTNGYQAAGLCLIPVALALALDQFSLMYVQLVSGAIFIATFLAVDRALVSGFELQKARMTDTASNLPNRRAMEAVARERDASAYAVARIDDFAQIEAVLDSEQVSRLDTKIAERLALLSAGAPIYRIDRAKFAWFIPDEQVEELDDHFATARTVLNSPIEIDDRRLMVKARFGSSTDSILDAVSAAEYARRQSIHWSATAVGLQDEADFQQHILGELDDALASGAIHVQYQPKMRLADKVVYGAECLVRWESETLGPISPADFIPILERKGQIGELTKFVLREALERSREAADQGTPIQLAVNVSAQLLSDREFINSITEMLLYERAKGHSGITLEVTESAPLQDPDLAKRALSQLSNAGARISIDDYGTGQATLNYLQGFPADEIKLDQSFVRNLVDNRADRIMVQSTIDLAHALSFEIVAEGVEDIATLELLATLGCDYVQGWQVGKPGPWHTMLGRMNLQRDGATGAVA